jgi:hypothetical protein
LRAAIFVIRTRASSVANGGTTWLIVGLFALGLIGVGVGADWLDSARGADDRKVATAQACANAVEVITTQRLNAEQLLPASCGNPAESSTASTKPSNTDQIKTTLDTLTAHYRSCIEQVIQRGETDASVCNYQLQIIVRTS